MRELKNSLIYFDKTVYKPGDILIGSAEINIDSPINIRGIKIKISGRAKVYWSESQSDSDGKSETVSDSNEEIYFKEKFYVLGNETSKMDLAIGQYIYPFKFLLPPNLPSSYEDDIGKIIYSVKATLDRPWKIDKFIEEQFIVEAPPSIPNNPHFEEPNILTMEKQFGLIFKSNPLKAVVKAPRSVFAPGQVIPLRIEVDNSSDTEVNKISIKLRQIITYHAKTTSKKRHVTFSKDHITNGVRPKNSAVIDYTLKVPENMTFLDFSNCKIIDIDYVIYVQLHTAGLTRNLEGTMIMCPLRN